MLAFIEIFIKIKLINKCARKKKLKSRYPKVFSEIKKNLRLTFFIKEFNTMQFSGFYLIKSKCEVKVEKIFKNFM